MGDDMTPPGAQTGAGRVTDPGAAIAEAMRLEARAFLAYDSEMILMCIVDGVKEAVAEWLGENGDEIKGMVAAILAEEVKATTSRRRTGR